MQRLIYIFLILLSINANSLQEFDYQELKEIEKTIETYNLRNSDTLNLIINANKKAILKSEWDIALKLTNAIANHYIFNDLKHQKADSILTNFDPYLKHVKDTKALSQFYTNRVEAYVYNNDFNKSLRFLKQTAIPFFEKLNDSTSYDYAYAYLKAGEISNTKKEFTESLSFFKKAEQLFSAQKDTLFVLWTKNGLATLFSDNGLFEQANEQREYIYKYASKVNKEEVAVMARIGASTDAQFLEDPQLAMSHIRESLKYDYSNSVVYETINFLTLCFAVYTYAHVKQIDSSNYYKTQLKTQHLKQKGNPFLAKYYNLALISNAYANGDYTKARMLLENNYKARRKDNKLEFLSSEKLFAQVYEKLGFEALALNHYKTYNYLRDSINTSYTKRRFAYAKSLFDLEKKDFQIKDQQAKISLLNLQNEQKYRTIWLGSTILAVLGLALFLWSSKTKSIQKQRQQEKLSQSLINSQEKERIRISKELHDGLGQKLMLITRRLKTKNDDLQDIASETLSELRSISKGLHPAMLERSGFTNTIEKMILDLSKQIDMFLTTDLDNIDHLLNKEEALHLYRIIQEVITNIIKHAKAKSASVSIDIREDKTILLSIKDNGSGIDYYKQLKLSEGLGLQSLLERIKIIGGQLDIKTELNNGTTFNLLLLV